MQRECVTVDTLSLYYLFPTPSLYIQFLVIFVASKAQRIFVQNNPNSTGEAIFSCKKLCMSEKICNFAAK